MKARSRKHKAANFVILITYIKTNTHETNYDNQQKEIASRNRISAKNREIGLKIGSLAYYFLYNKLSYLEFERFLPILFLNHVEIGQINHSEHFLRKLLDPCFEVLKRRLRTYLDCELPCTGRTKPVALMLDKGTLKHDTSQLIDIRTPCLKNGVLFENFFIDNPIVFNNSGFALTKLLIDTVNSILEWDVKDLRERLTGVCIDGQYIHLNIIEHLTDILSLPKNLAIDYVVWDPAHRLELACKYAKIGTKVDDKVVGDTKWLLELDNVLQSIMKKFRFGHNHSELKKIAKDRNQTFLEFQLFSDTRFMEYAHRTYDHFVKMYELLYEKLRKDENSAETEKKEEESENLQNLLVQLQTVVDLLFMVEISHLVTLCSKEFQRFDVLPFHAMTKYYKLKNYLHLARNSFVTKQIPSIIHFEKSDHHTEYSVWKSFEEHINSIINTLTFQNVQLLTRSERGRVTRSQIRSYMCAGEDVRSIIHFKFKNYVTYLDSLINHLVQRFEPWPEWVVLCNDCFNFLNKIENTDRSIAFELLLNMPCEINTLLDDEKSRLKNEYQTLLVNLCEVLDKSKGKITSEGIWYKLLTEERYYKNCKFLNHFSLRFLTRSFNECIVESEVSNMEGIQCSERPLNDDNAAKLNFISSNGPHPLVSLGVVEDMLTRHFGGKTGTSL